MGSDPGGEALGVSRSHTTPSTASGEGGTQGLARRSCWDKTIVLFSGAPHNASPERPPPCFSAHYHPRDDAGCQNTGGLGRDPKMESHMAAA